MIQDRHLNNRVAERERGAPVARTDRESVLGIGDSEWAETFNEVWWRLETVVEQGLQRTLMSSESQLALYNTQASSGV